MRELKQIVNGMREELREHLANGNGMRDRTGWGDGRLARRASPASLDQQTYRPLFSVDNQFDLQTTHE